MQEIENITLVTFAYNNNWRILQKFCQSVPKQARERRTEKQHKYLFKDFRVTCKWNKSYQEHSQYLRLI